MIGVGLRKRDGVWGFDFGPIGSRLVSICHSKSWSYNYGMLELLRQMNTALSALVIEDQERKGELKRQWRLLYAHYSEGLKTLDLEAEVLDLFR